MSVFAVILVRIFSKIVHSLKRPCKSDHDTNSIKSIKASTKKSFPENRGVRIILTDTKLSSQFNIKDDTNKQHKHNLVYFSRCPPTSCTDSYIGETVRRLSERVVDHDGRDMKSHIFSHCLHSNHETINIEHFKILNLGYNNSTYRRRISEALFVKQLRPSLTVQDNSVPLEIFNLF